MRSRIVMVAAAVLVTLAAWPAAAQAHRGEDNPDNPVVTHPEPGPVTLAAGTVCAFRVHITFPTTDLTRYTWQRNGQPVFAVEKGTMLAEFTNTERGTAVTRDLSGTGYYLFPDANTVILSGTRIVGFFHSGDSPPNKLLFSGGGFMSILARTADDGTTTRTLLVEARKQEDLCRTLG